MAASVTRSSAATSAGTSPTATVMAASPCQPRTIAPPSIDTMSPSRSVRRPGVPCTTSSFTDVQMTPGKPGTPVPAP
jgi:hypothetical protein